MARVAAPSSGRETATSPGRPGGFPPAPPPRPQNELGDRGAGLVYAASGSVGGTTVVAGRVLMRGGLVRDADEVIARAAERAERLGLR